MSTITKTVPKVIVEDVAKSQYLAQDQDEVERLRKDAKNQDFKPQYVWRNIALFAALHFGAFIGLYQMIFIAKWQTVAWSKFLTQDF